MREVAETGPSPFLFDGDAEKTERSNLRPQIARKAVGAIDLVWARGDLVMRKAAHGVAKHLDVPAQTEIQSGQAVPQHRSLPSGQSKAQREGQGLVSALKITARAPA